MLLRWRAATDNEAVYGYQVFRGERAEDGAPLEHHASVRGGSTRFEDVRVIGGASYHYALRPYDLAGNRWPDTTPRTSPFPRSTLPPPSH